MTDGGDRQHPDAVGDIAKAVDDEGLQEEPNRQCRYRCEPVGQNVSSNVPNTQLQGEAPLSRRDRGGKCLRLIDFRRHNQALDRISNGNSQLVPKLKMAAVNSSFHDGIQPSCMPYHFRIKAPDSAAVDAVLSMCGISG